MRLILFAAALSLAACAQNPQLVTAPPAPMDADLGAPSKMEAGFAIAETAAQVADAIGQAPPATLSRTTIDEVAIRKAFVTFDRALSLIDGAVAGGMLPRNSPEALTVRTGVRAVQTALNAASAAQRAGNAATYTAALRNARASLAIISSALAR